MKILHIIPTLRKGGAERLVLDIVKQLTTLNGVDVRLVIFRNEIKFNTIQINSLISIIPSKVELSVKRKWEINVKELQLFIDSYKPDVIHTHLFEAELVSRFCIYPEARWFSHLHDNMIQLNNFGIKSLLNKSAITNYYEKKVLFNQYKKNGGTHFIAISKHTEKYAKSIQSSYPITLLPNAIDIKRFQKQADFQERFSDSGSSPVEKQPSIPTAIGTILNLNSQPQTSNLKPQPSASTSTLNLINIGSFTENKNQQFLIDVLLKLNDLRINVKFYFLGEGELLEKVEKKAIQSGVQDQCHFLGNVENVEEYLWKSDVYVHAAKSEALGLTLIEAMASGLPVVTLDGGGNRDLMINGKNGFLIEKQNSELFADRILEVYQNKEMSDFNAEFAKQFDIESYCEKLVAIYQS